MSLRSPNIGQKSYISFIGYSSARPFHHCQRLQNCISTLAVQETHQEDHTLVVALLDNLPGGRAQDDCPYSLVVVDDVTVHLLDDVDLDQGDMVRSHIDEVHSVYHNGVAVCVEELHRAAVDELDFHTEAAEMADGNLVREGHSLAAGDSGELRKKAAVGAKMRRTHSVVAKMRRTHSVVANHRLGFAGGID